ncbi:LLM class flavin-dependent oxidoreductase [Amycolatopsis acidiphila]|uniref:LLM class flavin-dependent oxidoreductase n=1 Tax=Amycolatopsis acidiphila TaxID=715473 RepID=A0A557ZXU1_9PSEU|nr:LLM class flavin-dependent oxidoreductase [Amycolatopsis acidiphila]TVT16833.1 LLM class flavin-dependent oxidoreductase [Amycolatopsis acidiphila]UIJ63037.1 LLM class flavin-dependent oxidoreductase [Amycolatopsis acidiphila]GHG65776.1 N5,N10-methylene tetrahydromethanopterin reductase [Amycolatopsis acidiphila]
MTELSFGFSLVPTLDIGEHRELAVAAEGNGLRLLGIQDHPYVPDYLDTFVLAAALLSATNRISVFPDVANLPLRPPAMLAKTAAALDLVSGGRFELALGAGGYWDAIARMGVERRSRAEANAALEEAISILRAIWGTGRGRIHQRGAHYTVDGLEPGPAPAHPIEIWTGAQGPKALALTGRIADGWAAPIPSYLPYERWPAANAALDEAAIAAGRQPGDIRRIAQIAGEITDEPGDVRAERGAEPVRGTVEQWAALLSRVAMELPFTSFVFWPEHQTLEQVVRFGREVAPLVRETVAGHRA